MVEMQLKVECLIKASCSSLGNIAKVIPINKFNQSKQLRATLIYKMSAHNQGLTFY